MRKHQKSNVLSPDQLVDRVSELFNDPCYHKIRDVMVQHAKLLEGQHIEGVLAFTKWAQSFERILVKTPGQRFHLDAWFASSVVADLGRVVPLGGMMVPFYLGEWCYFLPPQPRFKASNSRLIYGISFPGSDVLKDLHLLDYPWLFHETGHHLLDRADPQFFEPVRTALTGILRKERRRTSSSSPEVRAIVTDRLKRYERFWSPDIAVQNWTAEIFADVIAVWTCGPAFIASFSDNMENSGQRPFETHDTHPPCNLRAALMIEVGQVLGWDEYLVPLRDLVRQWKNKPTETNAQNDYAAVTIGDLPTVVMNAALTLCRNLQLPQCTADSVDSLQKWIELPQSADSAFQLIVGAWLKELDQPDKFADWEASTLDLLQRELIG